MSKRIGNQLSFTQAIGLFSAGLAALAAPIVVGIVNAPLVRAQSPHGATEPAVVDAKFEVAAVKPCNASSTRPIGKGGGGGGPVRWSPGRLYEECETVEDLIRDAYLRYPDGKPWRAGAVGVPATSQPPGFQCIGCGAGRGGLPPISERLFRQEIKGSPAWTTSEHYTVEAKADGPATQELMRGPMLQALLEDRFKLRVHREGKEIPVYELTVAPGGPRLQPYREGSCASPDSFAIETGKASGQPFFNMCGWLRPIRNGGTDVNGTTIANLCRLLSGLADRDVIDKTGIAGMFDIHFDTYPVAPPAGDISAASDPAAPPRPPSDADQEQRFAQFRDTLPKLGLKLESAKGQGTFLVIDHVERPSGN